MSVCQRLSNIVSTHTVDCFNKVRNLICTLALQVKFYIFCIGPMVVVVSSLYGEALE